MATNPMTQATFGVAQVELEIAIKAKPARVWEALVRRRVAGGSRISTRVRRRRAS